jgi:hypothetical protein
MDIAERTAEKCDFQFYKAHQLHEEKNQEYTPFSYPYREVEKHSRDNQGKQQAPLKQEGYQISL